MSQFIFKHKDKVNSHEITIIRAYQPRMRIRRNNAHSQKTMLRLFHRTGEPVTDKNQLKHTRITN